jgi:hypothetical protein
VWRIAKRSTKGQRRTTTMEPIKCLLLLAAVLSFAAMNAAATGDVVDKLPVATRITILDVNRRVGAFQTPNEPYRARRNEDADACYSANSMGYEHCLLCCMKHSYEKKLVPPWLAVQKIFIDYDGICICRKKREGTPAVSKERYEQAKRLLGGEVENVVIDPEDEA